MGNTPRWPRTARSIVQAAAVVGSIGVLWLVLTGTGIIEIPACSGAGGDSCGFVVSALGIVAILFFVFATVATWIVVATGRGLTRVVELHRYGRWLTLRERKGVSEDVHDLSIEVEYHDASGGPVAGVEVALVVVGTDGTAHRLGNATAVTDELGTAELDVRVPHAPAVVTVHASVPANPGVKGVGGVFLVGAR